MRDLPELHRHLDGSLRRETLRELADEAGVRLPDWDIRFFDGMGLAAALARFEVTLSVLQRPDAVRRVAAEICEDAVREGVGCLEIRFAPQLHRGGAIADIVDAALDGIHGRAGLILCVLYGESPGLADQLVELARHRPGVVGLDLAGGPSPAHAHSMASYAPAFERARALGIGRTVHAGEGRPPAEIRTAIETLHAQRIGHACTLLQDEGIVRLALDRGITIEACPTSNVQTGAVPSLREHPLVDWLKRGLSATVCCDNTLLSDVDAPLEWQRAAAMPGMTPELMDQARAAGFAARFRR